MSVIFVTGIDTNAGKTFATGLLARYLYKHNKSVITQKIVQTGCEKISEDIVVHRKIMGMELTEEDKEGITCPYIFKYPGSPHLAARLEKKSIYTDVITKATQMLSGKYETVLLEGVGGIYVPLNKDIMLLDYIEMNRYPVIVVTSPKLGSINHTILTLDSIKRRGLNLIGILYNLFPEQDEIMVKESRDVFERYLMQSGFCTSMVDIPSFNFDSIPDIDFSCII